MGLLDGEIASTIGAALNFMMLDATIRRDGSSTVDARGNNIDGTPVTYACRGFRDSYSDFYRSLVGIPDTDIKIVLTASYLATVPTQDDKIQISGTWYQARSVRTDPATAAWEIQAFEIAAP